MSTTQCVLREVARGDHQYVPVTDVISRMGALIPGETIFVGEFRGQVERLGPYGSDERVICLPVSSLTTTRATGDEQLSVH
ncbi:MAG: hypothetical protein EKK48_09450 [Candidatus Melainabacteria bacterium]|nr:MAG: hypothetical protein EKK48_09450 [Candidatus Melainabacteria bacterium]